MMAGVACVWFLRCRRGKVQSAAAQLCMRMDCGIADARSYRFCRNLTNSPNSPRRERGISDPPPSMEDLQPISDSWDRPCAVVGRASLNPTYFLSQHAAGKSWNDETEGCGTSRRFVTFSAPNK